MEPVREQILNLQHISYTYHTLQGETLALSDISFSLKKGEFAAIVGPSGCGKSTLLSLICGLLPCTEGQIKINGKPLKESTTNVGYMLQHDELFEWRTIYNNVILGLEVQHALTARTKQRAHELLDIYGLGDFKNARPSELSGGMRQRVVIAIALACEPDLLICDEPTTALDVTVQAKILDLIRDIQKRNHLTVIYITHDLGVVARVADKVMVMYAGKLVEKGMADDIFYEPAHPYTWGLLLSVPDMENPKAKLYTIPGSPPNLLRMPKGDAFAPRNPYALGIDFEQEPPMFSINEHHSAATWLLHPEAPKVDRPQALQDRINQMKEEVNHGE